VPWLVADADANVQYSGVFENEKTRLVVMIPAGVTGGATLFYANRTKSLRVIVPPGGGAWEASMPPCQPPEDPEIVVSYSPAFVHLALSIDGLFFRRNGERFHGIESTEFPMYVRWLQGDNVTPVAEQRRNLGFNMWRVWLLNTSVYRIIPSDFGDDFYNRLPDFVRWASTFDANIDFTCFTQTGSLMPNPHDQQEHLDRIGAALAGVWDNVGLSKVNEADQHDNATAPGLVMPGGFLNSQGSNGGDAWCPTPTLNWVEYHSNGAPEWWRRAGHNAMEMANQERRPGWTTENTRVPDQDDSAQHCYDAAAAGALLCAANCFHSAGGKRSVLFEGRELEQAVAWSAGAHSVPLEFQAGAYSRLPNPSNDVIRVYRRTLGDGRFHEVQVRA
jgi:hypothetical protein